ncbi:hypothetical protein [Roseixanthobacter glucoisosaccharinicivorans]|uniref:hypothetical protein n=1 Tax=Roseixanthobacter glucoisosaccharinicivorans TaxID=3119923 RepID=UPI00372C2F49
MPKSSSLHDEHLRARLARLMSGDLRPEDVAKLYIGKRSSSYGRASFREIADFAAHPDLRNRGPVTDRIRDMRTTFKPMLDRAISGDSPPIQEILDRAESNFRMATDEQIARFSRGLKRKVAEPLLKSAVAKMRRGAIRAMTSAEQKIVVNFGDSVIWNPALRGQDVFDDFKFVMMKNGLVGQADGARMDSARAVVILHAITVMHGAAFDIGDGLVGELQAGFENRDGCLEVTAALKLRGYPKQVSIKVGLFWTDLQGQDHVGPKLAGRAGPWNFPIEIRDGKLEPIGSVPPLPDATDDVLTIDFPGER